MDSFHLPQGTWAMGATVGTVLRRGGNPLDLCPRFLHSSFMPSLPGPSLSKSSKTLRPAWQAFSVSWHTGATRAVLSHVGAGQLWEPTLTKGASSLSRGREAPGL